MTITIDRAGRVVLPKSIRDRFHLTPGTEIELTT
ncbi:MAG: Antidote-toxin recognition MazE, bacterial antitoxin, partial [Verrucomicrobiota bacterium]